MSVFASVLTAGLEHLTGWRVMWALHYSANETKLPAWWQSCSQCMGCHKHLEFFCYGCGLLGLTQWRCGVSVGCFNEGKPQIIGEGLVEATSFCTPKEEGSWGLPKRGGTCCMCPSVGCARLLSRHPYFGSQPQVGLQCLHRPKDCKICATLNI